MLGQRRRHRGRDALGGDALHDQHPGRDAGQAAAGLLLGGLEPRARLVGEAEMGADDARAIEERRDGLAQQVAAQLEEIGGGTAEAAEAEAPPPPPAAAAAEEPPKEEEQPTPPPPPAPRVVISDAAMVSTAAPAAAVRKWQRVNGKWAFC